MTISSSDLKPWDVWLAYVRFADHAEVGKVRPVVVLDNADAVVVAKVTTAAPNDRFAYCDLEDWRSEGLLRPSRVQLVPLFVLDIADFLNEAPLGALNERDRLNLNAAFRRRAE